MPLQIRRGLAADRTFTASSGEPLLDTDTTQLWFGDGITSGGVAAKAIPTGAAGGHLAGTYPNPTVNLSYLQNQLSADVATTTGGTWYNGPTITLTAGTWLIDSCVTIEKHTTTGTDSWAARISTGSTHYASTEQSWNSRSGALATASLSCVITVASSTQIWVQVVSFYSGGNIKAATVYSGSGNNASGINALRIV